MKYPDGSTIVIGDASRTFRVLGTILRNCATTAPMNYYILGRLDANRQRTAATEVEIPCSEIDSSPCVWAV